MMMLRRLPPLDLKDRYAHSSRVSRPVRGISEFKVADRRNYTIRLAMHHASLKDPSAR